MELIAMAAKKTVAILGGGFTGLRLAYLLKRSGYDVTVIEKDDSLGGMCRTFEYESNGDTYLFDYGPHLYFIKYAEEFKGLLGNDLIELTSRFCMYTHGKHLSYPLRPIELVREIGPFKAAFYIADFLYHRLKPQGKGADHVSLESVMTRRFGRKLFNTFYAPYIEKCCGLPANEITSMWAKERENVSGRSLMDNVRNKIRFLLHKTSREHLAKWNSPAAKDITAFYPRLGAGQVCSVMSEALDPERQLLNAQVTSINYSDGEVSGIAAATNEGPKEIVADLYVSTIPLPQLFSLLNPAKPLLSEVAARLNYRMVRLVCLIVDKERAMDCLQIFSMDKKHAFKRVYEPKSMSDAMAPRDKTSLCLEVCCNEGDDVAQMSPDHLAARCVSDLMHMGVLKKASEVTDSFVVNMPHAYPVYHKGVEDDCLELLEGVSSIRNLVSCGRQGLFRYHAMTAEAMDMAGSVSQFIEGDIEKVHAADRESEWGQLFF